MNKEIIKACVIPLAIISLLILELVALLKGVNGTLFSLVVAVIGGLAGYKIKEKKEEIKNIFKSQP